MIGYLRGKILDHTEGRLLLVIPSGSAEEAGAVGYSVVVPQGAAYGVLLPGKTAELFIHTHVREDALDLYGFMTPMEKDLFLTFLSVTGIGPKGAIGIMGGAEPAQLVQAILDRDKDFLTGIPGIGKKTAERVVLELADPLRKKMEAGVFGKLEGTGTGAGRAAGAAKGGDGALQTTSAIFRDAKIALVGLGYREQDVTALLNRLAADETVAPKSVEDVIRQALRQLA